MELARDEAQAALLGVQAARVRLVELMSRQGVTPASKPRLADRVRGLRLALAYLALRRAVSRGAASAGVVFSGPEPDQ